MWGSLDYYFWASPNKRANFRLQLYREAKRHLQVITIAASLFLDRRHAHSVSWSRGTRVVNRVGGTGVGFNVQTNRKFVRWEYNRWKPNDMSN